MHHFEIEEGSTSQVLHVSIEDTRLNNGGGLTGLRPGSPGLACYYMRSGQATPYCESVSSSVAGDTGPNEISLASSCAGQWLGGGFVEIDSDWMPGLYELQVPDACLASGAHTCHVQLRGADNMAVTNIQITLRPATIDANMTQISGDAAAADNLEANYDGTGYVDPSAPARQEQIDNLAIGSAAISVIAASRTLTTGSEVNSYTDTAALDGTYHELSDDAGTLDIYYEFNVGADGVPVVCTVYAGGVKVNDDWDVYAYNWNTTTWDQIGNIAGSALSTIGEHQFNMTTSHVGTGGDSGIVRVRFYNTGLTSSQLDIDYLLVSYAIVNRSVGYADGAIWVDTNNGTAGTTAFINGTADLPVDSWTDALSLSASLNIARFHIINGSSITLSSDSSGYTLVGDNWSLALNSQTIADIHVGGATVSGTGSGSGYEFHDCEIGNCTLDNGSVKSSAITSTVTISATGDYFFDSCYSGVAGAGSPTFDFGAAVGATNLNIRHYSGGVSIENMDSSDKMSLEGHGQLKIQANCSGGEITLRGHFEITDYVVGGFAGTLSDIARFGTDQLDDIADDVNTLKRTHYCRFIPSKHAREDET